MSWSYPKQTSTPFQSHTASPPTFNSFSFFKPRCCLGWCCLQAEWVWAIHRVWVAYQMPHSWRKMAPLPQKVVTNCLAWTEPHEASPVHDGRLWTSHAGSTADGGSWVRQPCPTRKTAHSPPPSCRLSTGCCVNAHEGPSNWKSLALSTLTG